MFQRMGDARLDELRFLARLEREQSISVAYGDGRDSDVRIAIHLLQAGLVNDATAAPLVKERYGRNDLFDHQLADSRWHAISDIHAGKRAVIYATHAAAVRRAELEQALQRDRLKDPTGILWDSRYAMRDLQIALWAASEKEPVVVAYLDMNGLREINNKMGHDVGDAAIRAFVEAIGPMIAGKGDAYRGGHADEVLVVLPSTSLELGIKILAGIMRGICATTFDGRRISAAAGLMMISDPTALPSDVSKRVDELMRAAKDRSKVREPWFCTLAVEGREEIDEFDASRRAGDAPG
jgi:diguanylate cyclase (GGDEF)-like protein